MGRKSHPHRDSIPDRPAHSQSLYRLSYPAHIPMNIVAINYYTVYEKKCVKRNHLVTLCVKDGSSDPLTC